LAFCLTATEGQLEIKSFTPSFDVVSNMTLKRVVKLYMIDSKKTTTTCIWQHLVKLWSLKVSPPQTMGGNCGPYFLTKTEVLNNV